MTGSVSDADDIVQDAWLRWQRVDPAEVRSNEAWLVRTTTNLAIDRSRAIARRRESYVGPFLPEPLLADARPQFDDPAHHAELVDSLTFAFLVMLDGLDPIERAVLLLHDVFGYPFNEVAAMVDRSAANCRQIATRTRQRLRNERVASRRSDSGHERRMLHELVGALAEGAVDRVVALLSPEIVVTSDGGAERHAARRAVVGVDRATRLLVNLAKRQTDSMSFVFVEANGGQALLLRDGSDPFLLLTIACDDTGRIARVYSVLNPDKLRHLGA
jgi:RNA polymerase sigma-70 factor, ECF subfamily